VNQTAVKLAQQAALLFGTLLVRIALRDVAWMTWQAAKDRMNGRANWRRRQMGLNFDAEDIMVSGPSGVRRVMDDDHIEEWWGESDEEYKGPLW
jgi:hypothetical protein